MSERKNTGAERFWEVARERDFNLGNKHVTLRAGFLLKGWRKGGAEQGTPFYVTDADGNVVATLITAPILPKVFEVTGVHLELSPNTERLAIERLGLLLSLGRLLWPFSRRFSHFLMRRFGARHLE